MPTQALPAREPFLGRAIGSVLSQENVTAIPLVVVNGSRYDARVVEALRADHRIRLATLEGADLPAALAAGRRLVDTPFFAELDDDDELLPRSLARRLEALAGRPDCDAVVTNGIRRSSDGDAPHVIRMADVERDPLRAFLRHNWLLPGSWLCRTDRVGPQLFDGMPRYRECTYIALRLVTEWRVTFLADPTVVYHVDTPGSVSKSREYVLGSIAAHRRILELSLPPDVHRTLRSRLAGCYRSIGRLHFDEGRLATALAWFLRSALQPGGMADLVTRSFGRKR